MALSQGSHRCWLTNTCEWAPGLSAGQALRRVEVTFVKTLRKEGWQFGAAGMALVEGTMAPGRPAV